MADSCPTCGTPPGSENDRLLHTCHHIHPRGVRGLLESVDYVKTTDPLTDKLISIMQHATASLKTYTALSLAINYGQEEWVATLLEKGADVEARNLDGDTPLLLTSKNEHGECVNVLIEGGADVNRQNIHGVTALINTNFEGTDRSET